MGVCLETAVPGLKVQAANRSSIGDLLFETYQILNLRYHAENALRAGEILSNLVHMSNVPHCEVVDE